MGCRETVLGYIPDDWKVDTMENSLEAIIDYRGKTPQKSEYGIPTISARVIKNGSIDYSNVYYISEETYRKFMVRGFPEIGDILLTTEAPLGQVAKLDRDDIALAQRILTLRGKQNYLTNDFLRYYLISSIGQSQLSARETGTTVSGIKQAEFRKTLITIPPYEEQKAIAHILSTLDEKIETNNRINQALEEMAQALFKHWFADFEFPNEDGEPYKSSGGEMVESELGLIPKGWKVGCIRDISEVKSGKRPNIINERMTYDFCVPVVGASKIMGYTDAHNYSKNVIVTGRVGTHGIIHRFDSKIWASDNTLVIIPHNKYYDIVYQYMMMIDYSSLNRGSTQPLITQKDIKDTKVLKPHIVVLDKFNAITITLYMKINIIKKENEKLSTLRDTLLPKLMSGEIRVPCGEDNKTPKEAVN